jgi:hypothetical protein
MPTNLYISEVANAHKSTENSFCDMIPLCPTKGGAKSIA